MGLREASLPFDWTRTKWKAIERSLAFGFDGFLNYDSLYQKNTNLKVYKDYDYGVSFVHDFNQIEPLERQIKSVKEKYDRRIERFFSFLSEPSLLIRYCMDYDELVYLSDHYDNIEKMIKTYNPDNEIIIVSHDNPENLEVSKIKFLFLIEKEQCKETNNYPIISNQNLFDILCKADYPKRESNLDFNIKKVERKAQERKTLKSRIKRKFMKMKRKKVYIHFQQC